MSLLSADRTVSSTPDRPGCAASPPPPCLIVNPRSFRNARGLADRASAAARVLGAEVVQADDLASLTVAIERILVRRQSQVVILSGDGTVQAVVDHLARQPAGAWVPELLVLPGGRSNLTALDLVPAGDAVPTLERGLRLAQAGRWQPALVERALLRIEQAPAPARHGFLMVGALIDTIVRNARKHRDSGTSALHVGPYSSAWFVAGLGLRTLVGRSGMTCPDLSIEAGAAGRLQGPTRVLLATTLQHRQGLFNPYADRGEGELRVTAVSRRAPRFRRSLPRILTGRFTAAMDAEHGYLSGRCERLQITGLSGYCLDGEEFDTDPARPVVVTAGRHLRLLGLGPA